MMKLVLAVVLAVTSSLISSSDAQLFGVDNSTKPCVRIFDLKHAFHEADIRTCETALVVELVTRLRKEIPYGIKHAVCPHDTGEELMRLVPGADSKSTAKTALVALCERIGESDFAGDVENTIGDLFPLKVNGCTADLIMETLEEQCYCDVIASLTAEGAPFSGTDESFIYNHFEQACTHGWQQVQFANWTHISPELTDNVASLYAQGGTMLNTGTGNLDAHNQDDAYPTDPWVLDIASKVEDYFEDGHIQDAPLNGFSGVESCVLPAIMCCFGRDRQSGDNNGDCEKENCDNKNPADNSNLCFIESGKEGSIHCHGFAWSENDNDVSSMLKYNNLFFVSLYDHWYTRGYVENALDSELSFPMCGCMEDMPAVSRSDCTEMDVQIEFTVEVLSNMTATAVHEPQQKMNVHFNACSGPRYDDEDRNKDNDLSTFINRLVAEEKMSIETQMEIFENHLVGYENPNNNNNEEACEFYMSHFYDGTYGN